MYCMLKSVCRLIPALIFCCFFLVTKAQPLPVDPKPYKLSTSEKQLMIRSSKPIKQVMVWTSNGNRVVEQKELNSSQVTVNIPVAQKAFFLMIGLHDGHVYTEKIGVTK